MKKSKTIGILVIIATYLLSFGVGTIIHYKYQPPMDYFLLKILVMDLSMTVMVWLVGVIFNNSSIYDPYWSVIPIGCTLYSAWVLNGFHPLSFIMIGLVVFWGLRLTFNFFATFKNLTVEDWRYQHYHQKFPKLWPLVNFLGINLFPTIIVYGVMLSIIEYMETCSSVNINASTIIAIIIAVVGILLELVSDLQMHKFLKTRRSNELIAVGLWKRSRHPNYLGEIIFWWGIYLIMLSINDTMWILFLGPLLNMLMFVFISIPLAEKHQLSKNPEYAKYQQTTNVLLIYPLKELKKND